MCAALVEDSQRKGIQQAVRALAHRLYPGVKDPVLHWRDMTWERKQEAAKTVSGFNFRWLTIVAYKPKLEQPLRAPKLYNFCTRMLLERLCLEVDSCGGDLKPVFSSRSRTDYNKLQAYVSRTVVAFGDAAKCIKPIATDQHTKERLLQLADICAGAVDNALEVNTFGNLQTQFLKHTGKRIRRSKSGKIWGYGFKIYPKEKGTDYGPPTRWIDELRKR